MFNDKAYYIVRNFKSQSGSYNPVDGVAYGLNGEFRLIVPWSNGTYLSDLLQPYGTYIEALDAISKNNLQGVDVMTGYVIRAAVESRLFGKGGLYSPLIK